MKKNVNVVVWQEGKWFVAQCLEVDVAFARYYRARRIGQFARGVPAAFYTAARDDPAGSGVLKQGASNIADMRSISLGLRVLLRDLRV